MRPSACAALFPSFARRFAAVLTCVALAAALGATEVALAQPAALAAPLAAAPASVPRAASPADASAGVPRPRWQASVEAFAAADREHPPPSGGVVFIGSSSIRLWDRLESQFSDLPVIVKRGFGGSRMSDCTAQLQRLVVPYRPRLVVVYAGDNDLAEGRAPQQVATSFRAFVEGVRRELPDTRIAYVSIKPSPRRAALLPLVRQTNALIADYTRSVAGLDYIDVFTPMLDAEGRPRAELFRADALHLNRDGYALWHSIIAAHVH
jgi:lysophospholipase L1-like esterase